MKIPLYQVDAFASEVFRGNPAAVCMLDSWLNDGILQSIAAENNLAETAFLVRSGDGFEIRWFTPTIEVALCGHATLASAFVLFNCRGWKGNVVRFQTRKSGPLSVAKKDGLLELDFPAKPVGPMVPPRGIKKALGTEIVGAFGPAEDIMVRVCSEKAVRDLAPDLALVSRLDCRGVIVTARGESCDFVSRFFAPQSGIPEDPVTGSAHCVLAPYWSRELGKKKLRALQVSKRGGELLCVDEGSRVKIAGKAVLFLEGSVTL